MAHGIFETDLATKGQIKKTVNTLEIITENRTALRTSPPVEEQIHTFMAGCAPNDGIAENMLICAIHTTHCLQSTHSYVRWHEPCETDFPFMPILMLHHARVLELGH